MEIRLEGDSSGVADAFGFGGNTIEGGNLHTPERETMPDVPEGSPETPEEKDVTEDTVSHEGNSSPEVISEDEKRMVIDTIERQLDQFDQGVLSAEDLQAFFLDKPEISSIANKSKRVKERYRSFVEGTHPRLQVSDTPSSPEEGKPSEPQQDKPLTLKDLDAYFTQKESSILEKQLQSEKERKFTTYAAERGIVDTEANTLRVTVQALASAHQDWSYDEVLDAAYRAIQPAGKPKPVHVISGGGLRETPTPASEDSIDLSKNTWSIDPKAFGLS